VPETVFTPARLGRLALENRIVLSPMTRMQAGEDGTPGEDMAHYYARYAENGVGLVMTEAAYVDDVRSRAYFRQPGMTHARHEEGWRRVADAVHQAGRPIILQLQHGGRLAEPGLHPCALGATGRSAAGASWQGGKCYAQSPVRAASATELAAVADAFAAAARRARAAGFDGVEIHGARGYLIDEILCLPGAALSARLAFPLDVVRAVRDAFPDGVLSFNLSLYKMDDIGYQPPGGRDEVAAIVQALHGAHLDVLHVTTRRVLRPEAFGAPLAVVAREAFPGRPLIVNGGVRSLQDAEDALAQTGAELVALARALLANPDWVRRTRSGEPLAAYAPGMERLPLAPAE
jgi:2,4-dienoyl-CoA reductase-like NADH-dependent reductase (Old Yellow Enzyme family)